MVELLMTRAEKQRLWRHLLPRKHRVEEAAFIFAKSDGENNLVLTCHESWFLGESDFSYQSDNHIELLDSTRARLIKHAHDSATCVVEFHSHLGPWPARFSYSDRMGFAEWVPHLRWRLQGRVYAAFVVTKSGFDGLAWTAGAPEHINRIRVGKTALRPTNLSDLEPLTFGEPSDRLAI
jgi:hypothetical protein